jgi:hypothetical protein
MEWTKPYCGVSHCGKPSDGKRWATVEDHGSFVTLLRWFPGCGFKPNESTHDTVEDAKDKAEKWMNEDN